MKKISTILFLFVALVISGCGSVPMKDYEKKNSFNTTSNPALDEISQTIISTGAELGWKMNRIGVSRIDATKESSGEMAAIQIRFNRSNFKISYKDSKNLEYDSKTKMVNSTYNSWVTDLHDEIQDKLKDL